MIAHDSWWSNERARFNYHRLSSTIIDYHAPFDQGLMLLPTPEMTVCEAAFLTVLRILRPTKIEFLRLSEHSSFTSEHVLSLKSSTSDQHIISPYKINT